MYRAVNEWNDLVSDYLYIIKLEEFEQERYSTYRQIQASEQHCFPQQKETFTWFSFASKDGN